MTTYKEAGVDILMADSFLNTIKLENRSVGAMDGMYTLDSGSTIIVTCDGVGTKLLLAKEFNRYREIGIDLVAMNVNDLLVKAARPILFLDYIATDKIIKDQLLEIMKGIIYGCGYSGCILAGGETAEMPGVYKDCFDLAGFAVGEIDSLHKNIISGKISCGDIVFALPSNGLHSNGFSLVRKIISETSILKRESIEEELIAPTKIYTAEIKELLTTIPFGEGIGSLVHITGGGIYNRAFELLSDDQQMIIDIEQFEQPIFKALSEYGEVSFSEMTKTFNMGVGFIAVASGAAAAIIRRKCDWKVIGEITSGNKDVIFI